LWPTKPLSREFFLAIRDRGDFYGRCRLCRNRRARERYRSTATIHEAEIESSKRNSRRRQEAPAA
jgi:hypothetical protein